ncbi:MAG: response regulator [Planctomycetota bacterium]
MNQAEDHVQKDFLDALDEPAAILDRSGIILLANQAFADGLARDGVTWKEFTGRALESLTAPPCSLDESAVDLLKISLSGGSLRLPGKTVWRAGEDEGHLIDLVVAPLGSGKKQLLVRLLPSGDSARDRQEAARIDRLGMLGIVAAGVAHDLNNQLSAAMNIAALLREELQQDQTHRRALEILEGSSRAAADLARRLLRFAGRGEPECRSEPLRGVIDRVTLLIRHDLPPSERMGISLADDLGTVRGDPVQLEQLAATLLLQAAAHAGRTGRCAFDASTLQLDQERQMGGQRLQPGRYALLEACHLRAATDPDETGRSLEVARRIAIDHGGALESDDDGETVLLRVLLPLEDANRELSEEQREDKEPRPRKRATVLVVDDEQIVREVAAAMLERLDCTALTAQGGMEALEMVRSGDPPIDLVLLDLCMAELDGPSTLEEMRRLNPGIKVMISTGLGREKARELPQSLPIQGILEKPFSLSRMEEALDKALD